MEPTLQRLGLSSLHETLLKHHVVTTDDLSLLCKEDMISIGISLGQRNRVLKWQREYKHQEQQCNGPTSSPGKPTYSLDTALMSRPISTDFLGLYDFSKG